MTSDGCNNSGDGLGGEGMIPDSLIDALLDGELGPDAREELLKAARTDPISRDKIMSGTAMIGDLRAPLRCPDLSCAILDETDRRRGFLSARLRRTVSVGRLAAAAVLLLATVGAAGLQRVAPNWMRFTSEPAHVSAVSQAVKSDSTCGRDSIAAGIKHVRAIASPLSPGHGSLRFVRSTERSELEILHLSSGLVVGGGHRMYFSRCGASVQPEGADRRLPSMAEVAWPSMGEVSRASLLPVMHGRALARPSGTDAARTDRALRDELP